jgi:hypothetical protein
MKEFSLNMSQDLQIALTHFVSFAISFLSYTSAISKMHLCASDASGRIVLASG